MKQYTRKDLNESIEAAEEYRKEYHDNMDDVVMRDERYRYWDGACNKMMEVMNGFSKAGNQLTADEARRARIAMGGPA